MRARSNRPEAPAPKDPSGDGDVPIRRKPTARTSDSPTPLGASEETTAPTPAPVTTTKPDPRIQELLADLSAQKERLQREVQREQALARGRLVAEILPVLDNLDRSLEASANSPDQPLREGVRMVRDQFDQVLRGFGVEPIDARGVPFDPSEHEAITMVRVDDPAAHRTVVDVFRPGYRQDGKLLRAAQVSVGDHRPPENPEPYEERKPTPADN